MPQPDGVERVAEGAFGLQIAQCLPFHIARGDQGEGAIRTGHHVGIAVPVVDARDVEGPSALIRGARGPLELARLAAIAGQQTEVTARADACRRIWPVSSFPFPGNGLLGDGQLPAAMRPGPDAGQAFRPGDEVYPFIRPLQQVDGIPSRRPLGNDLPGVIPSLHQSPLAVETVCARHSVCGEEPLARPQQSCLMAAPRIATVTTDGRAVGHQLQALKGDGGRGTWYRCA